MKKKSFVLAVLLFVMLILSACGAKASPESAYRDQFVPKEPSAEAPALDYDKSEGLSNGVGKPGEASPPSGAIYADENNKIIRTANLTIQTTEFDAAVAALNALTEKSGGYYESADVESGNYYNKYASRSAFYVVRVPRENYVAFRDGAGGIGHVFSISESAQDIGEAYYDTEARLATLTTKRDRLLALLEKAEYMEDIISLENALADVQYEIDRHTSTLRRYDNLVGYSTINIRLNEVVEITEEPGVKESFGSRLLASFKSGFRNFGAGLQAFILWFARNLMGIVIFAGVVVAVVFIARSAARRRRARKEK